MPFKINFQFFISNFRFYLSTFSKVFGSKSSPALLCQSPLGAFWSVFSFICSRTLNSVSYKKGHLLHCAEERENASEKVTNHINKHVSTFSPQNYESKHQNTKNFLKNTMNMKFSSNQKLARIYNNNINQTRLA